MRTTVAVILLGWTLAVATTVQPRAQTRGTEPRASALPTFVTSDTCMACHNSLTTTAGEDVSIGASWRASMMANSGRDPYWMAGVRREILDHPTAAAAIEDECTVCHTPMARTLAVASGRKGEAFAHLPVPEKREPIDLLAHDGVSCAACHQIADDKLGTPESFTGGYVVRGPMAAGKPAIYGPFRVDKGHTTIMRSSSGFEPSEATHIRQSELCATCHTLITTALDAEGRELGQLPEQAMYIEWRHSAFEREQKSCQSCHMPVVTEDTPITSVLGEPRAGLARHIFVGGNAFMLRMLNRYRTELGVVAEPQELDLSVRRTIENLQQATARVDVGRVSHDGNRLTFDVDVRNLSGHKLPTAYPSRRAWLHVTVRDSRGRVLFESGALAPTGAIAGNDNDIDPLGYEPHYSEIREPGQVQIYESIMVDGSGAVTTGLLRGVRYVKDNRLLPRGFDKETAPSDVAVLGGARTDGDFAGGTDTVTYSVDTTAADGRVEVDVELRFQSIGYRWAQNLKAYDAPEPRRFVGYYDAMAAHSSEVLAHASRSID